MTVPIDELERRLLSIPQLLEETLATDLALSDGLANVESWDITGMGGSQGPALLLDDALSSLGIASRWITNTALLEEPTINQRDRGLVIFSQGLSPNAHIALKRADSYRSSILVTSRPDAAAIAGFRGAVLGHPPTQEGGALVRLAGPACAALVALKIAKALSRPQSPALENWTDELHHVPDAVRGVLDEPSIPLEGSLNACLTIGRDTCIGGPLMWKWQEALYTPLVPSLDVLSFAHGPFQSLFHQEAQFLCLSRPDRTLHRQLWERLEQMLKPTKHRLRFLIARLPGPLAYFEFNAALDRLALTEVRQKRLDVHNWPGKGADPPLYEFCAEED
jgi:hypothetical protein